MSIVLGALVPHPPIIVPEIGGPELDKVAGTREAMQKLAREIKEGGPEAIVIISPHAPLFRDAIYVAAQPTLKGSFAPFGAPRVSYTLDNDLELVEEILEACQELEVPAVAVDGEMGKRLGLENRLDHGILVPLYYLREEGVAAPVVAMGIAPLPPESLYNCGRAIALASLRRGKRVVVMASGDLSHRLTSSAPAGFTPEGKTFDQKIKEFMENWDVNSLINMDRELVEAAGECGWRPLVMLAGSLEGFQVQSQVFSYEGPFGVGYLVARLQPQVFAPGKRGPRPGGKGQGERIYVGLARESLEAFVTEGRRIEPPRPLPPELKRQAGAFVSLKKAGNLRGCIGTIEAARSNLAEEIIANAISAGVHDPRFRPVQAEELSQLTYSVDVLGDPEEVGSLEDLDPFHYGVIVQAGPKKGVLLPNLEGVSTPQEQVEIACQKAGIEPGERVRLFRFKVERYLGDDRR